ncbi:uncharacterized protein [Procambarus clarkii]|uniref:uncharacterized protein n=1 Tax=Procambarus clarkii TaxID=6728 RepID=UPI001E6724F7|nr:uncharacterized protein LOC123769201 [Procambarus clarkii]
MSPSQLVVVLLRLLAGVVVPAVLTGSMVGYGGSGGNQWRRVAVMVVAVTTLVEGVEAGSKEPLTCWTCSSNSHGSDCYVLNQENITLTTSVSRNCTPEETFCTVKRVWYVVEAGAEEMDFGVNRTCAAVCNPSCMVIGDRTKIYSCTSCCSESYCNTGSSASPRHSSSTQLLLAALLAALMPTLTSALVPILTMALRPTSTHAAMQVTDFSYHLGTCTHCDTRTFCSFLLIIVLASSSASRNF